MQHAVPAGQGNMIGVEPGVRHAVQAELTVSGSRLDPQTAAVTITGGDPPVGLTGNYHLAAGSPRDRPRRALLEHPGPAPPATPQLPCTAGAIEAPLAVIATRRTRRLRRPVPADEHRRDPRFRTPWDLGADELPGVPAACPA